MNLTPEVKTTTTATGLTVEKFTVDGLDIIIKPNPAHEIIATHFYFKGGLGFYGAADAGIETLMFRAALEGTTNFPKAQLRTALTGMGTVIDSSANHDYSNLNMQCLRRHLELSWRIFADIITSPLYETDDVELARERQLNDYRQVIADPDGHARLLGDALFFAGHPYAVSPLGTEETIARLTAPRLQRYHRRRLNRSRGLVVIVGDVEREMITRLVSDGLKGLPPGEYEPPVFPVPGGMKETKHQLESRELPTNYVRGYFPAPAPCMVEDAIPMFVGLDILRDRFFEEVRTKRNLTYAVSSSMAKRRSNYGLLYVTAVDPAQAMSVMLAEIRRVQTELIPEKAVQNKIKVLTTETLMAQQSNSHQASRLAMHEIAGRGFAWAERRVELLTKVTAKEIRRVMAEYIKNINFCVLGDPAKGQEMLDAID